jgi:tripartite-type tricarboxylate transporter receptor subunit TctC
VLRSDLFPGADGARVTAEAALSAARPQRRCKLQRWNAELIKVLKSPDVVEGLAKHGLPATPGSREELMRTIARESAMWGRVIRERKITGE